MFRLDAYSAQGDSNTNTIVRYSKHTHHKQVCRVRVQLLYHMYLVWYHTSIAYLVPWPYMYQV